ncbi:hypothetical protein ABEB36_008073 [Hypothenemus hampei]|uniref:Uncharacterized protein n=1 Tax=Hypothenemus hampei TaxID=57062 RepID=A0ABD1EL25_HYPHA
MKVFTVIFSVALISLKKTIVIAECTRHEGYETRIRKNYIYDHIFVITYDCISYDFNSTENVFEQRLCSHSELCANVIHITKSSIPILGPNSTDKWINVDRLKLSYTNTSEIFPGFFNNLGSLTELEISHNEIKEIVGGVFNKLEKLNTLNLSRNLIENLSEHCFSGISNLKIVDLSYNLLKVIPLDVFKYQVNLTFVDISNNLLMNVENIFTKQPIHHLYLSHNNLQNIDLIKFFSANSLKVLDFSYNNLTILNSTTFENCTDLTSLILHHNKIQSLPMDIFVSPEKLKILDLSFNNLSEIPFGLLNHLRSLEYLNISNNQLTLDFHVLSTLSNLRYLNLQNIKIINMDVNLLPDILKNLNEIGLPKYDFKWNCSELARFTSTLRVHRIRITRGNIINSTNIFGIPCEHLNVTRMEMTPNPNKNYSLNMDNGPIINLINSMLFRYLDVIAQKLENKQKFVVQSEIGRNNTDFLLKRIVADLKNLIENIQRVFITWRNIPLNIVDESKSKVGSVDITAQALVKDPVEHNSSNDSNLVITNVLLLFILFCFLAVVLKNINYNVIKQRFRNAEELELVNQT